MYWTFKNVFTKYSRNVTCDNFHPPSGCSVRSGYDHDLWLTFIVTG